MAGAAGADDVHGRLTVRLTDHDDLESIITVEESAWPEGLRASRDQLAERLDVYPEGFWVAEDERGELVGVLNSQRLFGGQAGEQPGWMGATGNGWIRDTHCPTGDILYVVSLSVTPDAQGRGVGAALVQQAIQHARSLHLTSVQLHSRLPDYHLYVRRVPIEKYVFARRQSGEPLDRQLRFYFRLGFRINETADITADCMLSDEESKGYGVRLICLV